MKYNRHSRRMFLQGSGGFLLGIPFLTSLLPRAAWGQAASAPKRFISMFAPYDIGHNSVWLPGGGAAPTNIPQPNRTLAVGGGHHDIHWQPLREFAPTASSTLASLYGSSLSPYLESINIMRSLDYNDFRGHDVTRLLGGATPGNNPDLGTLGNLQTIDQFLNANRTFNPSGRPILLAGIERGGGGGGTFSVAPSGATAVETSPIEPLSGIYNALFNSGSFPETGASTPAHPRREMLSRVLEDFTRVMNSRNISSSDRMTLSDAMDKLSDVQKGLAAASAAQCSHKGLSKTGNSVLASTDAAIGKALADMLTAAIMCDSSRVFTVGLNMLKPEYYTDGAYDGQTFSHDSTHEPFTVFNGRRNWERLAERQAAIVSRAVAPLIQNLSAATDPANGKSYLYNSLIYFGCEAGLVHGRGSAPVLLAGNAGGALTSGNYIDYADRTKGSFDEQAFSNTPGTSNFSSNWYGVSYNRLLVTILQAMGMKPADYEKDSLNTQIFGRTDLGTANANLTSVGGWGYAIGFDLKRTGSYDIDEAKVQIKNYDLKQFRNKLPMPS